MKKMALLGVVALVVLTVTAPAFAAFGDLETTARSLVSGLGVQSGVDALTDRVNDSVPVVSDWVNTLVRFLQTYLGDVLSWLP